jgi:hypothetical protein
MSKDGGMDGRSKEFWQRDLNEATKSFFGAGFYTGYITQAVIYNSQRGNTERRHDRQWMDRRRGVQRRHTFNDEDNNFEF